jgi:hypothetical protein
MSGNDSFKDKNVLLISDLIIKYLRDIGVDRIYGAPGTSELSLLHSASRFGIKFFNKTKYTLKF